MAGNPPRCRANSGSGGAITAKFSAESHAPAAHPKSRSIFGDLPPLHFSASPRRRKGAVGAGGRASPRLSRNTRLWLRFSRATPLIPVRFPGMPSSRSGPLGSLGPLGPLPGPIFIPRGARRAGMASRHKTPSPLLIARRRHPIYSTAFQRAATARKSRSPDCRCDGFSPQKCSAADYSGKPQGEACRRPARR